MFIKEINSDLTYRIDKYYNITFVNDAWNEFAIENKGSHLLSEFVVGKNLFDFITCPATSNLYKMLLNKVRNTQKLISFSFRCDSQDKKRFMKMVINPLNNGGFEFVSIILSEESMDIISTVFSETKKENKLLTTCSWCNKIKLDDKWIDIEKAIEILDLFGVNCNNIPLLSHGMCEICFLEHVKEI